MNKWIVLAICILVPSLYTSQLRLWSFSELEKEQLKNPKPAIILIYTDWCKYCKSMKKVFEKEQISNALNQDFYTLFLNAEERQEISFLGKGFRFMPTGIKTGTHELAYTLGEINGQLSYPSLVILNSKHEIIFQYAGFIDAITLERIISKAREKY